MKKNTFSMWNTEEIKKLFSFVEQRKKEYICLSKIFSEYASLSNRKPNSVRNYYYKQLDEFLSNPSKAEKLEINLSLHSKQKFEHFSNTSVQSLIDNIDALVKKGYSVRKACLQLSNNNPQKMMRLQNKYQILKKQSKGNILKFPTSTNDKKSISETDINNLFLGLVRVIKRSVMEQSNQELISECEWANNTLRKTLVCLNTKDQELKTLNLQNVVLSKRVLELQNEITKLCKKNHEN